MTRQELFTWIRQQYGTEPEYPWHDWNAVLRHNDNNKWYGVVLEVSADKLGLPEAGIIDVLNVNGLTAYVDTEYQIEVDGSQRSIFLKTNDVVLDKSFIEPANIRKLCGKRRFTLAHECAHQILFQLDADDRKIACHKRPEVRKKGSRVLRTQEDWNEWQANSLGAAILMPQSEVDRAMWFINSRKPLTCYGWRFYNKDQVKIDTFCGVFGVSRSAAAIRLEQLGYLNRKKDYEYRDPLEVWP